VRPRIVLQLSAREVRVSVRSRWSLVGAASFALLAIAVAHLGMAGAERWGIAVMDRTSAALLNLVLLFVPLLTLPLGASSFRGEAEDGTLAYLVSQPVTRGEVFIGKLLGLLAAMSLCLLIGFGGAATFLGIRGGVSVSAFGAMAAGAWFLGVVTTALGVLLSVAARSRARALAAAVGAWLLLVFLCDFGVLALAATQALGSEALFGISLANPLQATKTLSALAISERLEILGPVGVHAVRELGRPMLAALLCGSLAAWALVSSAGAFLVFRRENLA
jgi:ABC-type transport system involved in multi-copper enzyme maturation permease subunit